MYYMNRDIRITKNTFEFNAISLNTDKLPP